MAYQAVPDVAQIKLESTLEGQQIINDMYFEISGGGINPTNLTDLLNAVNTWFGAEVLPLLSEDLTYLKATAIDLTTQTGPEVLITGNVPGGTASPSLPNNVSACVSFRTDQRGRGARGRNFLAGIPDSKVTLNDLDGTWVGQVIDAYFLVVGPGTLVAGWQWVIVSRFLAGVQRANGLPIPVTNVIFTDLIVDSQRRRLPGRGK